MSTPTPFGPFAPLSEDQRRHYDQLLSALLRGRTAQYYRLDFSYASLERFDRLLGELSAVILDRPAREHRAAAWETAQLIAPYLAETLAQTIPPAQLGWCSDQLALRVELERGGQFVAFVTTKTAKRLLSEDNSVAAFAAYVRAATSTRSP